MHRIQLAISNLGSRVFRNNCGALQNKLGQWIRFGVANPGGSDYIGWTPVVVTQAMVGKTIAAFLAIEIKSGSGKLTEDQENFIRVVNKNGGLAFLANEKTDLASKLDGYTDRLQRTKPDTPCSS